MLLLEQASLSANLLSEKAAHQFIPMMSEEYKTAEAMLIVIEQQGPIEGTFPLEMLPPAYSKCQNEEEIRQLNRDYQQILIYGDDVTINEIFTKPK